MITAWMCPSCKCKVPLDHFESCSAVHQDYAAAVLADRAAQRGGVRVSSGLGCPRKHAILTTEDVAVDPLSMLTAMKGTAWHAMLEKAVTEQGDGVGAEIEVAGVLGGIPVTGRIDRVRYVSGKLQGEDHKTGKDARAVFIRGGKSYGKQVAPQGSPLEYRVQLSIYAELYRQQFDRSWDSAAINWFFSAEAWSEPVAIIPIDQCLAHRPYDCDYTVGELLAMVGGRWQDMTLVGQSIKFGAKTGCDYCEVRDTCWTEKFGAPF